MSKLRTFDKQVDSDTLKNLKFPLPSIKKGENNNYFSLLIFGPVGVGKSTILLNLMYGHLKKKYNNIFMISPTAKLDTKFEKLVEELEEDNKFYEEYSNDNVGEIITKIKSLNKDDKDNRNLIIFDDCMAYMEQSTDKQAYINKLITTHRHLHSDIIILAQTYKGLNPNIRKNTKIVMLFPVNNRQELDAFKEINIAHDTFVSILEELMERDNNSFLSINFMRPKPQLFINFTPLKIKKEI